MAAGGTPDYATGELIADSVEVEVGKTEGSFCLWLRRGLSWISIREPIHSPHIQGVTLQW